MDGYKLVPYRDRFLDEMRGTGALPDVPLIVLTAMDIDEFKKAVLIGESESLLRQEIDGKRRLGGALAASVRRGENRLVDGAGQASLHWHRPDAVLQRSRTCPAGDRESSTPDGDRADLLVCTDLPRSRHGQDALGRRSGSLGAGGVLRCGRSWCVACSGVWTL